MTVFDDDFLEPEYNKRARMEVFTSEEILIVVRLAVSADAVRVTLSEADLSRRRR